jgi:hypothetical protein
MDGHWGPRIVVGPIKTASGDYSTVVNGCDEFGRVLSLAERQSADIDLCLDHDWKQPIGKVRAFERQANGSVLAAFEVPGGGLADGIDLNHGFAFSMAGGGVRHYKIRDPLVSVVDHDAWFCTHIGLVRGRPRMIGLQPVVAIEGAFDAHSRGGWPSALPWAWKQFLERTMDARRPAFRRAAEIELLVTAAPDCEPAAKPLDAVEQMACDFDAAGGLDGIGAQIGGGTLTRSPRRPPAHFRVNSGYIESVGGEPVIR